MVVTRDIAGNVQLAKLEDIWAFMMMIWIVHIKLHMGLHIH